MSAVADIRPLVALASREWLHRLPERRHRLELLDRVVIGHGRYMSLKERGVL